MKNLKFLSIVSLFAASLIFTSCSKEEIPTELQEVDNITESKAASRGTVLSSRTLPFINGLGRSKVSIIVDGNDLVLEARRSRFGGGRAESFGFFNVRVNGQRVSGARGTRFADGPDSVLQWRYSNVASSINSANADFSYRLTRREIPSSRRTVLVVPTTRFSL